MKLSDLFETTTCSRCFGSGKYSYCQMYGDTCFKCSGSGITFTKAAQRLADDYSQALRRARGPIVSDLQVGDILGDPRDEKKFIGKDGKSLRPWIEVTQIEATDTADGWSTRRDAEGNAVRTVSSCVHRVTLADGSVLTYGGNQVLRRRVTLENILARCEHPETVAIVRAKMAEVALKAAA